MMSLVSAPRPPSCRHRHVGGQLREQPAIAGPRLVDAEPPLHRPHARGDGMDDRDAELALERLPEEHERWRALGMDEVDADLRELRDLLLHGVDDPREFLPRATTDVEVERDDADAFREQPDELLERAGAVRRLHEADRAMRAAEPGHARTLGPRGLAGEPLEQRAEAGSRVGDAQPQQGAVHDRLTARGDRHPELALEGRGLPERRPAWAGEMDRIRPRRLPTERARDVRR